ncbi:hypothetical protein [Leifsonia sp. AG29]|uniref:hypothetical protein n=1 Tax=Leifsonia sp. AG29 TaxID=2598860 RepID=UPI00131CA00B|nr:hypothetical protein [Leifsonia sp. AG29]
MDISEWWPRLPESARRWLIDHNGEAIPAGVVADIESAGGVVDSKEWWVGGRGPDGLYLSDHAIDWVEAVANDEDGERF